MLCGSKVNSQEQDTISKNALYQVRAGGCEWAPHELRTKGPLVPLYMRRPMPVLAQRLDPSEQVCRNDILHLEHVGGLDCHEQMRWNVSVRIGK